MYYLIESKYAGPNQNDDKHVDEHCLFICNTPATTIESWCGTKNNYSENAHGEYETLDLARAAIAEKFGTVRRDEDQEDNNIVEAYRVGQYIPMSEDATLQWCYEGIQADARADMTDDDIQRCCAENDEMANAEGYSIDKSALETAFEERRDELRDEQDEDEDDE